MASILLHPDGSIQYLPDGDRVWGVMTPYGPRGDSRHLEEVVAEPPVIAENQRLVRTPGVMSEDQTKWLVGWRVVDKTVEEITAEVASEAEAARQQVIDEELAKDRDVKYIAAVEEVTALPDATALEKAHIFPPFVIGKSYVKDERFFSPRDGKLYKIAQNHTSSAEWFPGKTPALYVEVTPAGVIAAWKQPAGAHDAYQIGNKVTHQGKTWTNVTANNVWEPGIFGWNTP